MKLTFVSHSKSEHKYFRAIKRNKKKLKCRLLQMNIKKEIFKILNSKMAINYSHDKSRLESSS